MSTERRPEIIGLGKSRGSQIQTREQTASVIAEKQEERSLKVAERMLRSVGIDERGWLKEGEAASHLGTEAARQAMEMAGITIKDVTSMHVATGLPDYLGVPTGTIIIENLGGNKNIKTVDYSGACPGFFHALSATVDSLSNPRGIGGPQMAVAAEPASKGINEHVKVTYSLFGDGGGAFVMDNVEVDATSPRFESDWGNDPELREKLYVPAGGSRRAVDEEVLKNHLNCITMEGDAIKKAAIHYMTQKAIRVLEKADLSVDDVDLIIPHQANLQIIQGVKRNLEEKLKKEIPDEKFYTNIQRYGNTSAASVPIAIREAWEEGRLKRGDTVLAVTFGAGLNFAGAIIPFNALPENSK